MENSSPTSPSRISHVRMANFGFSVCCGFGLAVRSPFAIIKAEIEDFVDKVYNSIREFGYNLKTTPIVFVGGGAVVMKNFGSHDAKNISYNLDVKANARGYEQLATMGLKRH